MDDHIPVQIGEIRNNVLLITSTDVVLLNRRDTCIATKQRRLSAKAKLRTASRHTICKDGALIVMTKK